MAGGTGLRPAKIRSVGPDRRTLGDPGSDRGALEAALDGHVLDEVVVEGIVSEEEEKEGEEG